MTTADTSPNVAGAASGMTAASWPAWLCVAKVAKVPFWFIWLTPFTFGYVAAATVSGEPSHLLLYFGAAVGVCVLDASCNVHNELVDHEEDVLNQPNRTRLLDSVSRRALWTLVVVGYVLAVIGIVMVVVQLGPAVAAVVVATAVVSLLYNAGPRFKRRPILAELAIGWASLSAFLFGWGFGQPLSDLPPVAWLLTFFVATTAGLKDLPDAVGDEQVGTRRLVNVDQPGRRRMALGFIYFCPYAAVVAFVATGQVPGRVLGVMVLLPVAVWLAVLADRKGSLTRMIAAYQMGFLYLHVFSLGLFLLHVFTPPAAAAALILFVGRIAALSLGLDPRLVEPDFSWSRSVRALRSKGV